MFVHVFRRLNKHYYSYIRQWSRCIKRPSLKTVSMLLCDIPPLSFPAECGRVSSTACWSQPTWWETDTLTSSSCAVSTSWQRWEINEHVHTGEVVELNGNQCAKQLLIPAVSPYGSDLSRDHASIQTPASGKKSCKSNHRWLHCTCLKSKVLLYFA